MKAIHRAILICLAAVLCMGGAAAAETPAAAKAKISEKQARSVAHERFPDSAFESAELETEHGTLIWSIDLRPHGSNDIREVQIDALTGAIVATEIESPAQQAAERAEDQASQSH